MTAREPSSGDSAERSVPDRFESFDLSIERVGEIYRAHVTASPVGPRPPVEFDSAGLAGGAHQPTEGDQLTRDVRRRPVDRDDLRQVGEGLFRTVFVGAIEAAFRTSVERSRNRGVGLRVCLQLGRAPELAALSWEALWDYEGRFFLAGQPDLSVVRTLEVSAEAPDVTPAEAPLRVLALLPEPRGEGKLSGATEWQRIREHLTPLVEASAMEAESLKPPTLDALRKRIDEGPCDVIHIVAHGGPGQRGAGGLLKLEDGSGKVDPVSGSELTRALERGRAPRLVVLSTCHGARAEVDDAFDGLAQHLLNRGIPAVVAMRTVITDAAAVSFAAALYRELAKGRSVECAMVEARRALSAGAHRTEWATPVLYLRGQNIQILAAGAAKGALPARRVGGGRLLKTVLLTAAVGATGALGLWMWRSEAPEVPLSLVPTQLSPDDQPAGDRSSTPSGRITSIPKAKPGSCPPPLGLEDLRFVEIEPDVVNVGDRRIIVEQGFCIGTKEVSRRDWVTVTGGELPRPEWPYDWPMTVANPEEVGPFLQRLEARDPGAIYRLPTANEWELAARGGQTTDYFFGDDPASLFRFGNCKSALESDGYEGAAPVGSFPPNAWGLYDVHGNVAEWVQWPKDGRSRVNDNGQELALRLGGSFNNVPSYCAFGSRSEVKADVNRSDTGFRVVRDLPLRSDE